MERIGEILKDILDPSMVRRGMRFHELFHSWSRVVGRKLATVSRVHEVDGRTVVVSVDHPAALTSIMMIERRIVAALRRRFPALSIERVRIIVQPPGVRRAEPTVGLERSRPLLHEPILHSVLLANRSSSLTIRSGHSIKRIKRIERIDSRSSRSHHPKQEPPEGRTQREAPEEARVPALQKARRTIQL